MTRHGMVMPQPSSPSRGVAQITTPNQRARISQPPTATSTPESSSRHSSQKASGAAMGASAATAGRTAASLRAAIAVSAEVSVSTLYSRADVAPAPSTNLRQGSQSCRNAFAAGPRRWTSARSRGPGPSRSSQVRPARLWPQADDWYAATIRAWPGQRLLGPRNGPQGLFELFEFFLSWWAVLDLNQ